jgi:hypothetical protein
LWIKDSSSDQRQTRRTDTSVYCRKVTLRNTNHCSYGLGRLQWKNKSWWFTDVLKQIWIHGNYMYFMDYLLEQFLHAALRNICQFTTNSRLCYGQTYYNSCTSSSRDVVIRVTFPWQFVINEAYCVSYFFSLNRHPSCRSDELNSTLFHAQTSINSDNVTCTGIFTESSLVPEMKCI